MKIIHSKQHWKGHFTYLEGFDSIELYKDVEFTMEITLTENSFIGTATDAESRDAFDQPATIKGFIDDEKMSFIKKYPCAYYKDDFGNIKLDKSSQHPDIHYLGFFDDDKQSIKGNWEMTVYEERFGYDYLQEIFDGDFEMRRVN